MTEFFDYEKAWDECWRPGNKNWDEAADSWERKYRVGSAQKASSEKRIRDTIAFLKGRGALTEESSVLDIGCGPGRFVAEFARQCAFAAGVDISPKMTAYGAAYCEEAGLDNTEFRTLDFLRADLAALGWEKRFDLAFSSITPAVRGIRGLDNLIASSRGWCFNASFVREENSLFDRIRTDVFGQKPQDGRSAHADWFQLLFNVLWLRGYDPEIQYYDQHKESLLSADRDTARWIADRILGSPLRDADIDRVQRFLEENAGDNQGIYDVSDVRTGWLLWRAE